jgi:bifunctional DNA-binding transcriptional regulator/antitoxin component of YhaV-PrlF toxin-antitoxin module
VILVYESIQESGFGMFSGIDGSNADSGVRTALGLDTGDRVTLIKQSDQVIMINSAVYAMKMLQTAMAGEAGKAGLRSDDGVAAMVMEMRAEER